MISYGIMSHMMSHDWCSPVKGIFNLGRLGTDLDCIGAMRGVFKQSIVRIEQLPRYFEEKLALRTTIVKPRSDENIKSYNRLKWPK